MASISRMRSDKNIDVFYICMRIARKMSVLNEEKSEGPLCLHLEHDQGQSAGARARSLLPRPIAAHAHVVAWTLGSPSLSAPVESAPLLHALGPLLTSRHSSNVPVAIAPLNDFQTAIRHRSYCSTHANCNISSTHGDSPRCISPCRHERRRDRRHTLQETRAELRYRQLSKICFGVN